MTGPKTPKEKPIYKGLREYTPEEYKRLEPKGSVVILTGRGHNLKKSSGNPSTSKEGSEKK